MTSRTASGLLRSVLALPLALGAAALLADDAASDTTALKSQLESARESRDWVGVGAVARQILAHDAKNWEAERGLAQSLFHAEQYPEAVDAYKKALELVSVQTGAAARAATGDMLIDEGDCLLKLHRFDDAVNAYDQAAPLSSDPGKIYFNICTVEYNHGYKDGALKFAEKTLSVAPANAEAYYIKGSVLVSRATWDAEEGKYTIPDGAIEALNKYLSLKPTGSRADEVRKTIKLLSGNAD